MANFNEDGLRKKLQDLNYTTQCIQTMSLWLIHHKRHAHSAVSIWYKELVKAPLEKKLVFMYLANDVIQTSKKKGPEYNREFFNLLPRAFKHLNSVDLDEKQRTGLKKLLNVWEERGVYEKETIKEYKRRLGLIVEQEKSQLKTKGFSEEQPNKKHKKSEKVKQLFDEDEFPIAFDTEQKEYKKKLLQQSDEKETDAVVQQPDIAALAAEMRKEEAAKASGPPPDPEVLIQSLQELENAATADAEVRKKIASLPTTISDPRSVDQLEDIAAAQKMEKNIDIALEMLEEYNKRLATEMENRKSVARMLHDYVCYQKDMLTRDENTLEIHKQKLLSVQRVRSELKAHLQNLPDVSRLPKLGGGLAPLPSPGDLFT